MKYLSKILNLNWFNQSQIAETPEKDPRRGDISIAKFEDKGGIYLLCLDWEVDEVNELLRGDFIDEWEKRMQETGICLISGKIGKGEEIEVIHTSLEEVFEHGE